MSLEKQITLTIDKDYNINLDNKLIFYQNDVIKLIFTINRFGGIQIKDGVPVNNTLPINFIKADMCVERPNGVDKIEGCNIVNNTVEFNLYAYNTMDVGTYRMQIFLFDDDGCRLSLPFFTMEIKEPICTYTDDDITTPTNTFVTVDEALQQLQEKEDNITNLINTLSINVSTVNNALNRINIIKDTLATRTSVTGETINTENKGWLENVTIYGNTRYKWSDGTYSTDWKPCGKNFINATKVNRINFNSLPVTLEVGSVYTISGVNENTDKVAHAVIYKKDGTKSSYDTNLPVSFAYSADLSYVVFMNDITWESCNIVNIQMEKGGASSYEPYKYIVTLESIGEAEKNSDGKYPIEIVSCGKNLCKYNNISKTINKPDGNIVAIVPLEIGKDYFISGNSKKTGSEGIVDGFGGLSIFMSDTYYPINTNFNYNAVFRGDYGSATNYENKEVNIAQKVKATKKYLYFYVGSGFYNITFQISNLQVKEGTQGTDYEPYKENKRTILLDSPLRKVGEVADILDLENMKVSRKCKTIALDGSSDENWTYAGNNIFAIPFTGYKKVDLTTNSLLICDKFTVTSHNVLNNISGNYIALESSYTSDNYIKIRKPDTTDLATFKTWLASNPVTIVYALATPTTEDIQVSPTDNPLTSCYINGTITTENIFKGNITADYYTKE